MRGGNCGELCFWKFRGAKTTRRGAEIGDFRFEPLLDLSLGLGALADAEIVDCILNEPGLKMERLPHEPAGRGHLVYDEPGVVCGQLHTLFPCNFVDDSLK